MNAPLSLLGAFRALAPLIGDPRVDEVRNAAAAGVFRELQAIARRSRGARPDLEDAIQDTLRRLTQAGPRGERGTDPANDDEVRNYLIGALHNNLTSIERKQRRTVALPESQVEEPDTRPGPEVAADLAAQGREREDARSQLDELVRAIAKRRGQAAESFLRTVDHLRDISAGRLTANDMVRAECSAARGSADWRRARNNLDQRFARARRHLGKELTQLRDQGALTAQRYLALRHLIDELRVRETEEK